MAWTWESAFSVARRSGCVSDAPAKLDPARYGPAGSWVSGTMDTRGLHVDLPQGCGFHRSHSFQHLDVMPHVRPAGRPGPAYDRRGFDIDSSRAAGHKGGCLSARAATPQLTKSVSLQSLKGFGLMPTQSSHAIVQGRRHVKEPLHVDARNEMARHAATSRSVRDLARGQPLTARSAAEPIHFHLPDSDPRRVATPKGYRKPRCAVYHPRGLPPLIARCAAGKPRPVMVSQILVPAEGVCAKPASTRSDLGSLHSLHSLGSLQSLHSLSQSVSSQDVVDSSPRAQLLPSGHETQQRIPNLEQLAQDLVRRAQVHSLKAAGDDSPSKSRRAGA